MRSGPSSPKSGNNMGYLTYFSLQILGPQEDCDKMKADAAALDPKSEDFVSAECIRELVRDEFLEAKWYDFEQDFLKWAKRYPTLLMIVNGDGEDSDDIWQLRVKGDEYELNYITMPPFKNENLLTESEKIERIMTED